MLDGETDVAAIAAAEEEAEDRHSGLRFDRNKVSAFMSVSASQIVSIVYRMCLYNTEVSFRPNMAQLAVPFISS